MSTEPEQKKNDCLACRLVSGGGIVGMGVYLFTQSHQKSKIQMGAMRILAAGTVGLGIARLMNLEFLKSKS